MSVFLNKILHFLYFKFGIRVIFLPDPYRLARYKKEFGSDENRRCFNVGAAGFSHPYWVNIDFISDWYDGEQKNVLHHDLTNGEPLPIDDNYASVIYSSHTIEHICDEDARRFFREAYRALAPGGVLRITTGPDADLDYRALMNEDEDWFYWDEMYKEKRRYEKIFYRPPTETSLPERWLHHFASALVKNDRSPSKVKYSEEEILSAIRTHGYPDVLDYFSKQVPFMPDRSGNHINWWSHEKLDRYLRESGFETVYRSGYRQSVSPLMRRSELFDSTHPQMSLYVECVKGRQAVIQK